MAAGTFYKSGEFARMCGTTKDTLRHYDEKGILSPSSRSVVGYALYTTADYFRFVSVRALADAGMPLSEVRLFLAGSIDRQAALEDLGTAAHKRMDRLERAIAVLSELSSQARRLATMKCEAPRIEERGAKRIVVFDDEGCTGGTSVSPRVTEAFRGFLEALPTSAATAPIMPYGAMGRGLGEDGRPMYERGFCEVPKEASLPSHMDVITVSGGRYLSVDYDGDASNVGDAYEMIAAYARERNIALGKTWFETCLTGMLDGDWERHLRCEVSVRVL